MPGDSNSTVELANLGQELNRSYENVLPEGSFHRSKSTCLKATCIGVLLFGQVTIMIYLLAKPEDSKQLINVTDSKLLYQMKQQSQDEERIASQLINALNGMKESMESEMKLSMEKASSMFFRMIRLTQAENTLGSNETHIEANKNNAPEIQLYIGDFTQCFKKGLCKEGHLIEVTKAENVSTCMEICHDDDQCQWVSFDMEFQFCTLFRDCPEIDIDVTRSKCITSKVNCPLKIPCKVTGRCEVSFLNVIDLHHELIFIYSTRVQLVH